MAPVRVRSRTVGQPDAALRTPSPYRGYRFEEELPLIDADESFRSVIKKLSIYITETITLPVTFEQLRTTAAGDGLRKLVEHLRDTCTHPAVVNALLALKWHYGAATDYKSLNEARANACEIVAWRFLTHLSEREVVDLCLYEIPEPRNGADEQQDGDVENFPSQQSDETTALLAQAWAGNNSTPGKAGNSISRRHQLLKSLSRLTMSMTHDDGEEEEEDHDPTLPFINLNALEIAAIADAKRFLSQNVVQKIITGIWNGDIIFWNSLSAHAVKKPRFYNHKAADPFSRLRVPKYLKSFEVLFFASFMGLYYAVLVERDPYKISTIEIFLYIWFAAFFYDELSEWLDAGSIFYAADVWNMFDIIMLGIGVVFAVLRIIGISRGDRYMIDLAFDVLALESLFMVPRIFSVLSLSPYWGTLIPCLKEMGKDFLKFMVLVFILYLGFLTTFSLVGRDTFSLNDMVWVLTKIFFGSSYVGFDIMNKIDPLFGPPLMLIFVTLSSILLMGSLTGMLSNSFSRVISHAREEYLYVYSIYVLEASTSNRLTHFYPPFNLLALVIFRPLRLILPYDARFRAARIVLLKATHLPVVGAIKLYELVRGKIQHDDEFAGFKGPKAVSAASSSRHSVSLRPHLMRSQKSTSTEGRGSGRRVSVADMPSRLASARQRAASRAEEDAETDAPTDVEVRIAELSSKIDKLTDLVLRLQEQNAAA